MAYTQPDQSYDILYNESFSLNYQNVLKVTLVLNERRISSIN